MNNIIKKDRINQLKQIFNNVNDTWIKKHIEYDTYEKIYKILSSKKELLKIFKMMDSNKYDTKIIYNIILLLNINIYINLILQNNICNHTQKIDNIHIDSNGAYYIYKIDNNILIRFTETSNLNDVITNITMMRHKITYSTEYFNNINIDDFNLFVKQFKKKHNINLDISNDIYIHNGIYKKAIILVPLLLEILQYYISLIKENDINILCYGYSLGGALADIISLIIKLTFSKKINKKTIKVYCATISAPCIGNKTYNLLKFYYNIPYYQIYNSNDLIYSALKIRYYHTSYLFTQKKDNIMPLHKLNYYSINLNDNLNKIKGYFKDKICYHRLYALSSKSKILSVI